MATTDQRNWPADPFTKALAAEPKLRALDRMVRLVAATAPDPDSGEPFCSSCFWEGILKPLTTLLVGWQRGERRQAREQPSDGLIAFTRADLDALTSRRPKADNETEEWLRSMEAYDAVTNQWLAILYDADPANGHGLPDIQRQAVRS